MKGPKVKLIFVHVLIILQTSFNILYSQNNYILSSDMNFKDTNRYSINGVDVFEKSVGRLLINEVKIFNILCSDTSNFCNISVKRDSLENLWFDSFKLFNKSTIIKGLRCENEKYILIYDYIYYLNKDSIYLFSIINKRNENSTIIGLNLYWGVVLIKGKPFYFINRNFYFNSIKEE